MRTHTGGQLLPSSARLFVPESPTTVRTNERARQVVITRSTSASRNPGFCMFWSSMFLTETPRGRIVPRLVEYSPPGRHPHSAPIEKHHARLFPQRRPRRLSPKEASWKLPRCPRNQEHAHGRCPNCQRLSLLVRITGSGRTGGNTSLVLKIRDETRGLEH